MSGGDISVDRPSACRAGRPICRRGGRATRRTPAFQALHYCRRTTTRAMPAPAYPRPDATDRLPGEPDSVSCPHPTHTRPPKDTIADIYPLSTYYYWYSITHSLFHSRLKSFLFCKILPTATFLFSHSGFTIWISQTIYCYF